MKSGSQVVYDYEDIIYVGNIGIGTPQQMSKIILDTGSANLWVPDASCGGGGGGACSGLEHYCADLPNSICHLLCPRQCCNGFLAEKLLHPENKANPCDGKNKFNSSTSTSYQRNGQSWSIQYGTGSASGFLGVDTVCFGNSTVCATPQTFGQATSIAAFFANQPIDGILGLAFTSLAVDSVVPPFITVMPTLDNPWFTVWMTHDGAVQNQPGGLFTYGALDPVHCATASITWVPLSSATYFQFTISGIAAGSYSNNGRSESISDTGTSLIGGPDDAISGIATALDGQYHADEQIYYIDCNASPPNVTVSIHGGTYTLTKTNYIVPSGNPGTCILAFFAFGGGGFGPSWIFGDPFIRQYCNTYDVGHQRLGLAWATM